jgi:hypothetical protein
MQRQIGHDSTAAPRAPNVRYRSTDLSSGCGTAVVSCGVPWIARAAPRSKLYSSLPGGSPRLHDILPVASSPPCLQLVPAFSCLRYRHFYSLIRNGLLEIVDILARLGDVQRIADGAMRSAEELWQHALMGFSGFVAFRGKMLELLGINYNLGLTFDGLSSFSSQHCISTLKFFCIRAFFTVPPLRPEQVVHTLAVLNIVPPEQKNGGSIADNPINLDHLLGMLHIVDLIC